MVRRSALLAVGGFDEGHLLQIEIYGCVFLGILKLPGPTRSWFVIAVMKATLQTHGELQNGT
jgi:hypothetical protein